MRKNLPQIITKRYVNSPRSSDVRVVHSERSAKRMKVDQAAASAAAAATLGKFRNDLIHDFMLFITAGQSSVLTITVTLHKNWRIQCLIKSVVINDCTHHTKQTTNNRTFYPDVVHTSCWRLSRYFSCRATVLLVLIQKIFWRDRANFYFSTVLILKKPKRVAHKNYILCANPL